MVITRTRARLTDITVLAISTAASLSEPDRGLAGDVAAIGAGVDGVVDATLAVDVDSEAGDLTIADADSMVADR